MISKPQNRRTAIRDKRPAILATSVAALFALCLVPPDAHAQNIFVSFGSTSPVNEFNVVGTYNTTTGASINASFIPGLNAPAGLALSGNILYVANSGSGIVGEYNATTGAAINASLITGLSSPTALAFSGNTLFVLVNGNKVSAYNATTGALVNANFITSAPTPDGLAVSGNNLFVSNDGNGFTGAGSVGEYNATTGAVINAGFITGLRGPSSVVVSGNNLFVGNATINVSEYNATTGALINPTFVTGLDFVGSLALSGNDLFAASVGGTDPNVGEYNATTGATINASLVNGLWSQTSLAVSGSAPAPAAPATYWLGGTDGTWTGNNWASDATGTPTTAIPTNTDDITFSATGGANQATTTLGQDFTIHSLTISDPAAVTIGGTNTLTISGNAGTGINVESGAGLFTLNANLTLAGSSNTITVNNTAGAVINGVIAGSNGLNVNGTGTLILTNSANSYTGGTAISGATLQIGTASTAGSIGFGAASVSNGGTLMLVNLGANTATNITNGVGGVGTLNINSANTNTIAGALTDGVAGQLAVTQSGSGTTILTNTNTYSGATTVSNGVLQAGSTQAFGVGSAVTLSGGTLDLHGFSNSIGSLADGGFSTGVVDNTASGTATLTIGAATPVTTFSGTIQNSGGALSLTYQGANNVYLVLDGANTYSGTTTINAGAIEVGSNNALGTSSVVVNSGGTLSLLTGVNVSNPLTISGNGGTFLGNLVGALVVNNLGDTATYSGAITLAGNALISPDAGTLTLSGGITKNGFTLTFGPINGAGTVIVNTVGIGGAAPNSDLVVDTNTVTENVANTYNGGTWITNGGKLNANVANALPTANGRSAVTMDPAAAIPNSTATSPSSGGSTLALGASQSIASLAGATTSNVNLGINTLTVGFGTGSDTNGTANANFAGVISGTGGITKDETSTQILSGANSYTGPTTVNGGTLQIGDGVTAGTTIAASGSVQVNAAATLATNLPDGSTFANAVFLNAANAALSTLQMGTNTLSGVINGTGVLNQNGSGTTILSNTDIFTGATNVNAGTLQVGNGTSGNLTGTSGVTVANNATLATNLANGATFTRNVNLSGANAAFNAVQAGTNTINSVISGTGVFNQNGTGTTILGNANLYTGNTTVNAGTLEVDGSIASLNTIVNSGGTLQGLGTIVSAVNNGGTVQPGSGGSSIGKLTVNGSYTQTSGGNLRINLASATNYSQLQINGTANLNGTLTAVAVNGFHPQAGQSFQVISASGGLNGTRFSMFNNQTGSTGTLLQLGVSYSSTPGPVVNLQFVQGAIPIPGPLPRPPGQPIQGPIIVFTGLPPNEIAVARVINGALNDPRMAGILAYLDRQPLSALPALLDRISPEELSSLMIATTALSNVQTQNVQGRMGALQSGTSGFTAQALHIAGSGPYYAGGFDGPSGQAGPNGNDGKESKEVQAPAIYDPRLGTFLTGEGEWVNVSNTDTARGYDLVTGGFTLGVDYKFTPNLALGINAGYAHTGVDLENGGRSTIDGGKFGFYGTYFTGGFYVDTAVTGGYNSYSNRRSGLQGEARGDTDGGELDVLFGTGYDWHVGALSIGPTANFQYSDTETQGYTEHGSLAPMSYPTQSVDSIRSAFGLKATYNWKIGGVTIQPELATAWQHEYADTSPGVITRFANGAGGQFSVFGPEIGRDSLLLRGGFAIFWSDRITSYVYYDGEFARTNYEMSTVSGGLRITF